MSKKNETSGVPGENQTLEGVLEQALPRRGRKVNALVYGVSDAIVAESVQRSQLIAAKRYRNARAKEFDESFGATSAGVEMMLSSAALQLAASRLLFEQFAISGDPDMAKTASKLATEARQSEQAAWDMAAKELSLSRAKLASGPLPWELPQGRPPSEPAKTGVKDADDKGKAAASGEDDGRLVWENEPTGRASEDD